MMPREELEGLRRLSAFSPPEGLNIPTQSSIEQSQDNLEPIMSEAG